MQVRNYEIGRLDFFANTIDVKNFFHEIGTDKSFFLMPKAYLHSVDGRKITVVALNIFERLAYTFASIFSFALKDTAFYKNFQKMADKKITPADFEKAIKESSVNELFMIKIVMLAAAVLSTSQYDKLGVKKEPGCPQNNWEPKWVPKPPAKDLSGNIEKHQIAGQNKIAHENGYRTADGNMFLTMVDVMFLQN